MVVVVVVLEAVTAAVVVVVAVIVTTVAPTSDCRAPVVFNTELVMIVTSLLGVNCYFGCPTCPPS